ncbi:MAG: c-type cytochrome, partial [Acidobacteriota bacterium]|nr:c-type cytochrome [Acidobacteriota bacterium]
VRAYDVRTGKRLWIFHTIPRKGEFGYDTWLDGSAEHTGNTGLWTQMTVDEKLGLAYLPIESPTGDYYGGHRPGNDLFGESLVCVDLKTGQRKWHYQLVHHPLWDMDISSAPLLVDIDVGGKPIKAVAQPTKQGFLYVFDRVTGKPVWPIEERPVEKGNVPGEWYSPTQPFPTNPPAYSRNGVTTDLLIDFTPELHAQALQLVSKYKLGPVFTPPVESEVPGPLATLTIGTASGGTNWPGASFDPETHIVYAYACNACVTPIGVIPTPGKDISDMRYVLGTAGQAFRIARGPGENAGADSPLERTPPAGRGGSGGGGGLTVQGLPLLKPPYSTISAISLDTGSILWQIPAGETPDAIRNHPALKGLNSPRTGQPGYNIGTLVTKTLVIAGDGQVTASTGHPRGAMLRAYDKKSGREVGAVWMPAPQSGSPMTYMAGGKQYIVVAVSGGAYSGEYIAFTLPDEEAAPAQTTRLAPEQLYTRKCASCHGARLTGGESAPALAGSEFLANWSSQSVGALVERIRITMPAGAPGTLSREESSDLAGFIMEFNRQPAKTGPNGAANPYRTIENYFKLPEGRPWGSVSAIFVAANGHIWIAERCGANSCDGKTVDPILEFDASGRLLKSFGGGLFKFPHGIFVDPENGVWVADEIGNQVVKFDANGKVLMKLPGPFDQPNAVIVASNGDIFTCEGHAPGKGGALVKKFSKEGTLMKQWGGHGTEPGKFEMPHSLAFDSQGRLYVADRGNDRIQVFDRDGNYIEEFKEFGRPSGLWIDKNDILYSADSESREGEGYGHHPGWKRGIRIGSLKDRVVTAFIPDTATNAETASTTGAEGVAVDAQGNVYGAEVGQKDVKKYVK